MILCLLLFIPYNYAKLSHTLDILLNEYIIYHTISSINQKLKTIIHLKIAAGDDVMDKLSNMLNLIGILTYIKTSIISEKDMIFNNIGCINILEDLKTNNIIHFTVDHKGVTLCTPMINTYSIDISSIIINNTHDYKESVSSGIQNISNISSSIKDNNITSVDMVHQLCKSYLGNRESFHIDVNNNQLILNCFEYTFNKLQEIFKDLNQRKQIKLELIIMSIKNTSALGIDLSQIVPYASNFVSSLLLNVPKSVNDDNLREYSRLKLISLQPAVSFAENMIKYIKQINNKISCTISTHDCAITMDSQPISFVNSIERMKDITVYRTNSKLSDDNTQVKVVSGRYTQMVGRILSNDEILILIKSVHRDENKTEEQNKHEFSTSAIVKNNTPKCILLLQKNNKSNNFSLFGYTNCVESEFVVVIVSATIVNGQEIVIPHDVIEKPQHNMIYKRQRV